jgi:uncharacterized secreted protein with C-terminal beta-propeller domain
MKKIIALMLVLLLMLTMFVACGDKEDPNAQEPSNQPSNTETPADEPVDEEMAWDKVSEVEKLNQNDGTAIELPRVPIN